MLNLLIHMMQFYWFIEGCLFYLIFSLYGCLAHLAIQVQEIYRNLVHTTKILWQTYLQTLSKLYKLTQNFQIVSCPKCKTFCDRILSASMCVLCNSPWSALFSYNFHFFFKDFSVFDKVNVLSNTNNAQATAVISFIDIWVGNSGLILNKDCKFPENLESFF